ncbi:MAG: serine/threonine-protein kinase, partial [Archaeoglobaceae archaeon]
MSILLILAGALTYLGKSSKIRDLGNKLKLKVLDKLNFIRSSILLATVLFVLGLGAGGTPGGILILISMSFLLAIAIVKAENTTGKKFGNIALYTGITLIVASLFIEVIIPKTVSGFLVAFGVLVILSALFGILRIKTPKMAKALGKWLELSDYSKKSKVNEDEKSIPLDTLLRNYEIIEFLGEGGFAKVFKAKRKSDGKIVALKIPRIDESTSKSFISEVSAWIHLEHKNIVKLYSADIIPVPYLEMEFVQGLKTETGLYKSLDELEKPLNERLAVHFVRKIAEGLLYAHRKGIVHRDLKPKNILLEGYEPKITDWGLAKMSSMSLSFRGFSPLYAAPEQLIPSRYGSTDHRTDIWQLGLIFYELLTGKLPFEGYSFEEVFGKITDEKYRFRLPSEFRKELRPYDDIILKMLARDKDQRYQSLEDFLADLSKLQNIDAENRRRQLEQKVRELRETLSKSLEDLRTSKSAEEILKNKKVIVETLCNLCLAYAELNRKAELLNSLSDLKFYVKENLQELLNSIKTLELMIKENLSIDEDFVERQSFTAQGGGKLKNEKS